MEQKTVLFVENTKDGELTKRLKELMKRIGPSIGFGVKVVERTGATLRSKFPLTNLWDGAKCGRGDCVTCEQGAKVLPACSRTSVVYENVCSTCNPEAGAKELGSINDKVPSLYVGESSRTLYERTGEHWKDVRSNSDKSHMIRHQQLVHQGAAPNFVMRAVKFYRTALSRQIGEAVRIMRRGGEGMVLNSKSEFDRCRIPRLQVEEQNEEELRKKEEQELEEDLMVIEEQSRE